MSKLKSPELAGFRREELTRQGGRCKLCHLPCSEAEAVADHDHDTGFIRGILHRGCNSLLGKVENNEKRYGIKNLAAFLNGAAAYLQKPPTAYIYPTHKTADEKRLARNTKARKKRAVTKKESA